MSFNKTHSQKTLSQSVAPQFGHSHNTLRLSVTPHSNHIERTLSSSVGPQLHHLYPTLRCSVAPQLNPHAAPFVPQEMRAAKEYNSRTVPQVTSTLNPNAVPFVSRRSTFSTFMTNEGSGLTSSTQKQAIIKGQKRKLEEDAVFCKARKENEQGEPPRKKHCSISIAESYPRPRTFIQQESSNNVGEKVKESKSSGVEQLLNCKRSPIRVKQASTTGREMRVPLRPITNKAKVQKHNGRVSRNAKKAAIKAAITAVITAEKEAEKMKREEEKRKEQKKRRERSRQIDLEALERRKIRAQQQRMLDKDLVARARFLHEYAERIAYIKKERYMNRTHKKLSPYYHRALYNIYRKLS